MIFDPLQRRNKTDFIILIEFSIIHFLINVKQSLKQTSIQHRLEDNITDL